ncbi:hypothetical protein [Amycolatopsis suaedae]|uniref:hypothetical protein n=1 Tax=Amycolatopsis suaedae TaxID=2510978 RepID=UPI00196A8FE4|nr:hypothetical protein [Amycolatopsis suaedae]
MRGIGGASVGITGGPALNGDPHLLVSAGFTVVEYLKGAYSAGLSLDLREGTASGVLGLGSRLSF